MEIDDDWLYILITQCKKDCVGESCVFRDECVNAQELLK